MSCIDQRPACLHPVERRQPVLGLGDGEAGAFQGPAQHVHIDAAGAHDRRRILIIDQREKQVLKRRIFVPAFIRQGERAMQGLFEAP